MFEFLATEWALEVTTSLKLDASFFEDRQGGAALGAASVVKDQDRVS
jgi:hypothetical protein